MPCSKTHSVLHDRRAVAALFESDALLVDAAAGQARGAGEIASWATETWKRGATYAAAEPCVLQAGDTALVLTADGIAVARRQTPAWRYAIALSSTRQRKGDAMTGEPTSTEALRPVVVRAMKATTLVVRQPCRDQDDGGRKRRPADDRRGHRPARPRGATALHHRDDEGFWILEGDVTFEVGDATIEAHAGDYVFGPREIPHRYTVGSGGCRMLFIMVPSGLEALIRQTSQPAASRTVPPPPDAPPDWYLQRVKALGAELGYELLG